MEKIYGVKPDVTSLDEDLKQLRSQKFTREAVEEIKNWIFASVLKETVPQEPLLDVLKSGTVLCKLANVLSAQDNGKQIKYKESRMPFVQMEQISQFLSFARQYGVPESEMFQTIDLYEESDPASVYQLLKSLSRYANKKHPQRFPVLGPQLVEKRVPPPIKRKPDHLKGTEMWSTQEYGYMGGASQSTEKVVFGQRRNIL
ncbi:transgelin [Monosporozyma servazzii]